MRIVEEEMAEIPGQDAFLDVLTNMVGIIILLVVVMGLRASRAAVESPQIAASVDAELSLTKEAFETACREAQVAESEVGDRLGQVLHLHRETELRDQERRSLVTYVSAFQQEIGARRAKLSTEEQRGFDLRQQLMAAQKQLDDLTQEHVGLMSKAAEVEVIENKPTPIARRSTGKMLYMQLRGGHVAVLPFKAFEKLLVEDLRENIWRIRDNDRFTRTIGPIDGFRVQYYVQKRVATMSMGEEEALDRRGEVTSLARFEFIPDADPLGEPVEEALQAGSELSQHLHRFPPDSGVLAIMVFPDSLPALHRLKKSLYAAGYSIAEAPIPNGQWISFSTEGGYQLFAQ